MVPSFKQYDIFISYVVEDRKLVETLCRELEKNNLRVWYASHQLLVGSNITDVIKDGLKNVRYGILFISPDYKGYWSDVETFVLLDNKERILPILHNKSIEEALQEMPFLQQIWCATTKGGINNVVTEVCKRIQPKQRLYYLIADANACIKRNKRKAQVLLFTLICIILIFIYFSYHFSIRPSHNTIDQFVNQRLTTVEALVKKEFEDKLAQHECSISSLNEIERLTPISGSRRFHFNNGEDNIRSLVQLKNQGIVPSLEPITPPFGLTDFKAYIFTTKSSSEGWVNYALVNLNPHLYAITDKRLDNDIYEVDISYTNPIRYIEVYIDTSNRPHFTVNLIGTKPKETLVFERNGDLWIPLLIR
jgi:hypothetical protein